MRVVCCFCRVLTYLRTCGLLNEINCESCLIEACRWDSMSGHMHHIWITPASFSRTLYAFEVKHFSNKPTRLMSSMHTGILLYGEFEKCYAQTVFPSVLLLFPAMCFYLQQCCFLFPAVQFYFQQRSFYFQQCCFFVELSGWQSWWALGQFKQSCHPWLLSC